VERRDDGHAQLCQQGQDVAARSAAEDAVFVLQRNHVDAVDVQKVGRPTIGVEVLLGQLEAHARRVGVPLLDVINGQGQTLHIRIFGGNGLTQVRGEGSNAALAWQVVADESYAFDAR